MIRATSSGLKRLKDDDAAPREQGRVDLERRVLGGGPDQADRAVLDGPQQGVLLGLVEAMDLVDEEDRASASGLAFPGLVDGRADLADTRENSRERDEFRSMPAGDQAGQGRLAGSRRSPENQRRQFARRAAQRHAQERFLADDIGLAHEFIEGAGPHPFGQRRIGSRGGELAGGFVKQASRFMPGHRVNLALASLPRPAPCAVIERSDCNSKFPAGGVARVEWVSLELGERFDGAGGACEFSCRQ